MSREYTHFKLNTVCVVAATARLCPVVYSGCCHGMLGNGEHVGKQSPVYTSSRYEPTVSFIWSHDCAP